MPITQLSLLFWRTSTKVQALWDLNELDPLLSFFLVCFLSPPETYFVAAPLISNIAVTHVLL
jgi:hypothetical protein